MKNDIFLKKRPTQRRSKEIVASILEATTRLLKEKSDHRFSTNTVAEKAGVSIGSLYQYFSNKESIFSGVINLNIQEHREIYDDYFIKAQDLPLEEFLDGLFDLFYEMLVKQRTIKSVFFKYADYQLRKPTNDLEDYLQKKLAKKLSHYPEKIQNKNPDLISFLMIHSVLGVFRKVIITNTSFEIDELKEQKKALFKAFLT